MVQDAYEHGTHISGSFASRFLLSMWGSRCKRRSLQQMMEARSSSFEACRGRQVTRAQTALAVAQRLVQYGLFFAPKDEAASIA